MKWPALTHYAASPLGLIYACAQTVSYKPRGLWLSVDDGHPGWREWCEGEDFGLDRLACVHDVTLRPDANVLWLKSSSDIDSFDKEYAKDIGSLLCNGIDWTGVAAVHQGIIIAPYCWGRRLSDRAFWYYSWDCASGCVWDPSAIESVRLAEALAA